MSTSSTTVDSVCAAAVAEARAAALSHCGNMGVGEHRGVIAEDTRVATHLFACDHPGYPGWQWSVTVTRAARARTITVNEVCLVPGQGSLLAPMWVPWADRVQDGDVVPGVLMPTADDDPRLEPGFTGAELGIDTDPAEWSQIRAVIAELGLGRERILSAYGRDEAIDRWLNGDGGPDNAMTRQAPGVCETCGYFIRLSGSLGRVIGVCANQFSPADGKVVSVEHGCGAHSDVLEQHAEAELPRPVWDTLSLDDQLFD